MTQWCRLDHDHKHGETGTCYVSGKCRCDDCRAGRARYARELTKRKAYGRFDDGLTDIEPVREHVEFLRSKGMGWKFIAEQAGVGYTAVSQIIYGRKGSNKDPRKGEVLKRIKRETADKILAVRPVLRPGARVPNVGTRRRIQSLVWMGYSLSRIGAEIGVAGQNMQGLLRQEFVSAERWLQVKQLFDEWSMVVPDPTEHREKISVARSRRMAREKGWVPPLAWTNIDDPDETPEGVGERRRNAVDRELVEWCWREGLTDSEIADRTGYSARTVFRVRQELGLGANKWVA